MAEVMTSYSQKCDICGGITWHNTEKDRLDKIAIPVKCSTGFGEWYIVIGEVDACPQCLRELYDHIAEKYTAYEPEYGRTVVRRKEGI